jgi:two-component system nitrogen regulation response regulator NtrX
MSCNDAALSAEDSVRRAMSNPPRSGYVTVNCVPAGRVESVLFGGRSPMAVSEESAVWRAAGGTLVLRDADETPEPVQSRLAGLLRERLAEGGKLTGAREQRATLRVVALTTPGAALVPDLRFYLGPAAIAVPPLRDRREDIPGLVHWSLGELCRTAGTATKQVSAPAMQLLAALPWRGNLADLDRLLAALVAAVPGRVIRVADVLSRVTLDSGAVMRYRGTLREAREQFERDYVTAVLEQHRGRMTETAKALGLQRTNLYRKVRQLSVRRRPPGRVAV